MLIAPAVTIAVARLTRSARRPSSGPAAAKARNAIIELIHRNRIAVWTNDFDLWDDTLVFNGWSGAVEIGASASGDVQFTFDNGGVVILTNVDYQAGMTLNDFNIEWN